MVIAPNRVALPDLHDALERDGGVGVFGRRFGAGTRREPELVLARALHGTRPRQVRQRVVDGLARRAADDAAEVAVVDHRRRHREQDVEREVAVAAQAQRGIAAHVDAAVVRAAIDAVELVGPAEAAERGLLVRRQHRAGEDAV
jgi:hypothetical protein